MNCCTVKLLVAFFVSIGIGFVGYNILDKKINSLSESDNKIQSFSEEQKKVIDDIVKASIKKNPDTIVEAMNIAIQAQQSKLKESMEIELVKNKQKLLTSTVFGSPTAEVKVAVILDPLCGHCLECHKIMHDVLEKRKDVAFYVTYVGILGPNSVALAKTYLAASKQSLEKLEKLSFKISTNKEQLSKSKLLSIASEVGLNTKTLEVDEISKEVSDMLDKNTKIVESIRLPGVPFIIGFFVKSDECIIIPPVDVQSFNSILDKLKEDKSSMISKSEKTLG